MPRRRRAGIPATCEPERVKVHDFVDPEQGRAIPYGVYDLGYDEGWVSMGNPADTAEFAVASIRRWWRNMGAERSPKATRLLITADAGGSNSYRARARKVELAKLAAETALEITVCHYPPGTSKWNKIEHRMFNFITMTGEAGLSCRIAPSSSSSLRPLPKRDCVSAPNATRRHTGPASRSPTPNLLPFPLPRMIGTTNELHDQLNCSINRAVRP